MLARLKQRAAILVLLFLLLLLLSWAQERDARDHDHAQHGSDA